MKTLIKILLLLMLSACAESMPVGFLQDMGDGIYVHHGEHLDIDVGYQGDICNISVVVGSKGVAVIDTAGSLQVGKQLRSAIAAITQLPILYVINTHVHPDHIFGNAAFIADKPTFVGHEFLAEAMQLREEGYKKLNEKYLGDNATGSDIVIPTLVVKDLLTLDLGDRELKLQAYPNAHTNTDITVIDSKTQTLFTGDLLFIARTPVIEGDIKGLIATLEQLKAHPSIKFVVPGHGQSTSNWVLAIDNQLGYLNVLLHDVRAAIANDVGLAEAMDTAAASEKDKWVLFDVANRRNINTIYPTLEWE
ncbi:MAG: quinoprotein relay system zinc metallohydrolase 2 [Methylophilaceae bacterium]|jgi:quinoprotein relay system zinc metallohydrolase 2|nr:MAG: quinoprotein relay system zinc metallohydrolase 2 [Methylophilaceae bacterium]